ncbi:DUF3370 family protein [Simiduia sp. 21SJ11W-1]|uniref:DUF3370 family protein n=1 Tax=Simiduia sp. 21SJ11W-1 TaxID=2909669 RepID=UPI00209E06B7|nr:DUF3370 family protein [Simiduia sp. 21SJ11W-1]UTA48293.1 DUF3370 family protein [Simiduia sp. 21SJ11W-1]
MKKIFLIIGLMACHMLALADPTTRDADAILANQTPVYVNYNCSSLSFDVPPLIVEGTTFVEVNGLFTAMGIALQWDGAAQKVTGTRNGTVIELWIGSTTAKVNGSTVTLSAAPFIATPYNRTMVPVAFIAQATGAHVAWENTRRTVIVSDAPCTSASDWQTGALNGDIVDPTLLEPLAIEIDTRKIWKSNNPETVEGDGWLMQSGRVDALRGGSAYPLSGCFDVYLFHINKSGSTKYVHLLASNPNGTSVTITGRGSMYNNSEKPLVGAGGGLNYQVVYDFLFNTPRTTFNTSIAPSTAKELVKIPLSSMIDGRYEICASKGVYLYTVATSNGSANDAVNLSQSNPAPGFIAQPDVDKFGREAGVYQGSGVQAVQVIDLPVGQGHIGFNFNTTNKIYTYLQDQTSGAVMHLGDSSDRTHGNYGHRYQVTLHVKNTQSFARTVSFSFASNLTGSGPSFTWNSPAKLNGSLKNIYVTPQNPAQFLNSYSVPAQGSRSITLDLYVPGLITTNQQLILEVN